MASHLQNGMAYFGARSCTLSAFAGYFFPLIISELAEAGTARVYGIL